MALARENTLDYSSHNVLLNQQIMTMDKEKPFVTREWSRIVTEAIDKNRLDVVKFIFKIGKISPTYEDNYFFGSACISGNLDIVKYFLDEVKVDIRRGGNYAIRYALNADRYDILYRIFEDRNFSMKVVDQVEKDNPKFQAVYKKFQSGKKLGKFKDFLDL